MNNILENEINSFRTRFMSHIPDDSPDISLPILKAHLLAEELLSDYIHLKVKHPKHLQLEKNHWSFINKLELASSLANDQLQNMWIWTALNKLNALRNRLSHSLEPKDIEKKINEFKEAVNPYAPNRYKENEITIYGYVLFVVSGLFIAIKSEEGKITK